MLALDVALGTAFFDARRFGDKLSLVMFFSAGR